jgi:hypothetical protein
LSTLDFDSWINKLFRGKEGTQGIKTKSLKGKAISP